MTQPQFKQIQYGFAAHIRDPEHVAKPEGIEDRRMAIYSELFYNNVESFVSSSFPVLRTLYNDEDWHGLVRDYFSRHKARTPHFPEMAEEFIDYLQNEFTPRECDPDFMLELAHYEWVEAAVMLSPDNIDDVEFNPEGDLLDEPVVISPLVWLMSYEWPVHTISNEWRPNEKPDLPTWIVVYRDRQDEVGFMRLNPVTARLLQLLNGDGDDEEGLLTGRQALEQVIEELNHPQPQVIMEAGLDTLRQFRKKDIVLGTSSDS